MPKPLNLISTKFGRLTVIEKMQERDKYKKVVWKCVCQCGKTTYVNTKNLRTGNTKSCGCLHIDTCTTHGLSKTKYYKLWVGMLNRCNNPKNPNYKNYGAKGITVCKRWHKFENFMADMGERPDGMSIERINNSKGYSQSNCKWATDLEQTLNRSNTRLLTYKNRTQCLSHWAKELGIRQDTLSFRIRKGWDVEKALTTPVKEK